MMMIWNADDIDKNNCTMMIMMEITITIKTMMLMIIVITIVCSSCK
jgi:hypothetical protein